MKYKKRMFKQTALLQMFKKGLSPIEHKRKIYYKLLDNMYVDNTTGEYLYYSGKECLIRTRLKRGSGQNKESLIGWINGYRGKNENI